MWPNASREARTSTTSPSCTSSIEPLRITNRQAAGWPSSTSATVPAGNARASMAAATRASLSGSRRSKGGTVARKSAASDTAATSIPCRAVFATPRNVSDEQMRAIADRGGVLGVMALPLVVDPAAPTLDRLVHHVEHAVDVMGIDHVALGGDFILQLVEAGIVEPAPADALVSAGITLDKAIEGLAGPEDYGDLVTVLCDRGFDAGALEAIVWRNLVRVIRAALL